MQCSLRGFVVHGNIAVIRIERKKLMVEMLTGEPLSVLLTQLIGDVEHFWFENSKKSGTHLIRFVHHAAAVRHSKQIDVIVFTALGEFVRLNVLQTDNRLSHDAAMPITANTLFACNKFVSHSANLHSTLQFI